MKEILVFRHGKSDWDASFATDHERPLAKRGRKASAKMGKRIARIGKVPGLVISSTAVRARDTARRAIDAGGWDSDLEETSRLYGCSIGDALTEIQRASNSYSRLMLVGHNPTWALLVEALTGAQVEMPTACLAIAEFPVTDWQRVTLGKGELGLYLPPRLL